MRGDLSKVTFTASVFEEMLANDNFNVIDNGNDSSTTVRHSKRVTLLLQVHKFPAAETNSGLVGSSSGGSGGGQMSKLTFTNVFDSHGPEDIKKLERVYAECHGRLPSRRQLSAIAQAINIQQSKIKKWFEKRAAEESRKNGGAAGKDTFWADLNVKMKDIDDRIQDLRERQFMM